MRVNSRPDPTTQVMRGGEPVPHGQYVRPPHSDQWEITVATPLPYLPSYKRVEELFKKIADAKQPESFTHAVLMGLGFKGTGDRPLIGLLKTLGFVGENAKPTPEYARLKNPKSFKRAMADAIRRAYKPLFENNERFGSLPDEERSGIVAEVSGADSTTLTKINGTLNRLLPLADFTEGPTEQLAERSDGAADSAQRKSEPEAGLPSHRRTEFHYNIQIHLPANGTEESYLQIFNAMKRAFA